MNAAEMFGPMLVLDARIAVAEDCVRSVHDPARAKVLMRSLESLHNVRASLEAFQDRGMGSSASWDYLTVVQEWAAEVASAIRTLAQEHDHAERRSVAERSCSMVLDAVVPAFALVERSVRKCNDAWNALLRLQADVVDLNWTLAL